MPTASQLITASSETLKLPHNKLRHIGNEAIRQGDWPKSESTWNPAPIPMREIMLVIAGGAFGSHRVEDSLATGEQFRDLQRQTSMRAPASLGSFVGEMLLGARRITGPLKLELTTHGRARATIGASIDQPHKVAVLFSEGEMEGHAAAWTFEIAPQGLRALQQYFAGEKANAA